VAPDAVANYYLYNDLKRTQPNGSQGQVAGNYTYDAIGNLKTDISEGITNISWSVYGKILQINKADGTVIKYTYDAGGNRISKTANGKSTWYVRDASGNACLPVGR
jgi:YD repeat-containing protein